MMREIENFLTLVNERYVALLQDAEFLDRGERYSGN